jgi:hypothetical protein
VFVEVESTYIQEIVWSDMGQCEGHKCM